MLRPAAPLLLDLSLDLPSSPPPPQLQQEFSAKAASGQPVQCLACQGKRVRAPSQAAINAAILNAQRAAGTAPDAAEEGEEGVLHRIRSAGRGAGEGCRQGGKHTLARPHHRAPNQLIINPPRLPSCPFPDEDSEFYSDEEEEEEGSEGEGERAAAGGATVAEDKAAAKKAEARAAAAPPPATKILSPGGPGGTGQGCVQGGQQGERSTCGALPAFKSEGPRGCAPPSPGRLHSRLAPHLPGPEPTAVEPCARPPPPAHAPAEEMLLAQVAGASGISTHTAATWPDAAVRVLVKVRCSAVRCSAVQGRGMGTVRRRWLLSAHSGQQGRHAQPPPPPPPPPR